MLAPPPETAHRPTVSAMAFRRLRAVGCSAKRTQAAVASAAITHQSKFSSLIRILSGRLVERGERRFAQAFPATDGRSGMTRLMRRRLDHAKDDMERTMYALAALSTHSPLEWENHDPEDPTEPLVGVVERALGIGS